MTKILCVEDNADDIVLTADSGWMSPPSAYPREVGGWGATVIVLKIPVT